MVDPETNPKIRRPLSKKFWMRSLLLFPLVLFLNGCSEKLPVCWLTPERASWYFKSIEDICTTDNGKLWGKNLFGPIMFVDRASRTIITNIPDSQGLLKGKNGVYTGSYPKEMLVNLAPMSFGGTTYAMVPIPSQDDEASMKRRVIHSLFHLHQQSAGMPYTVFTQGNLEEQKARIYLKLEWKALRKALESEGDEKLMAIRDALVFRGTNRELYPRYSAEATRFETYEGLATFTYFKLSTSTSDEFRKKLIENLDRAYNMRSYSRMYGNVEGSLYATLLFNSGYDMGKLNNDTIDLGRLIRDTYKIELPAVCRDIAGSLAFTYDVGLINQEEEKRKEEIKESLHKQTSTFTEKAIVMFELESPSFDFEPEDIHPLDTMGVLYSSLRVLDNWGKLTVDKGGCLVSNNYKYLRITAKGFNAEKNHISGEGWQLILNNDWELADVNGNYLVRKLIRR